MSGGALYDRDVVAVLVEVLSNVVAGVAAADDKGLFAFRIGLGIFELTGMAEFAFEPVHAFDLGHIHFSTMTSSLNNVTWMKRALLYSTVGFLSLKAHSPLPLICIPVGGCQGGLSPNVQLQ